MLLDFLKVALLHLSVGLHSWGDIMHGLDQMNPTIEVHVDECNDLFTDSLEAFLLGVTLLQVLPNNRAAYVPASVVDIVDPGCEPVAVVLPSLGAEILAIVLG